MIAAGSSVQAPAVVREVLGARWMLWIGQRSYAIYLWHWPALVLVGVTWGPLSLVQRLVVVAGSVALAALSYRLVENPVRHSPWMASPSQSQPRHRVLVAARDRARRRADARQPPRAERRRRGGDADPAGRRARRDDGDRRTDADHRLADRGSRPPTVAPTARRPVGGQHTAATTTTVAAPPTTPAPAGPQLADLIALQQGNLEQGLTTQEVPSNLHPSLSSVRGDLPAIYDHGCVLDPGQAHPPDCVYGNPDGAVTVAILGDSHAAHWYPPLEAIATAHNWRLLYFSKKGCPPSEQPLRNALANRECTPWRDEALAKITAARPNLIILTGYHYATASGGVGDDIWRDGMTTTLTKLGDLTARTS